MDAWISNIQIFGIQEKVCIVESFVFMDILIFGIWEFDRGSHYDKGWIQMLSKT
jgi:hypothetical protein